MNFSPHTVHTADTATTYGSLLQLDVLLDLQPADTHGTGTNVALEKHFFIVIHQAFELWFKQIIQDIDGAIADLAHGEPRCWDALAKLHRVAEVQRLLVQQMRLLSQLDPAGFLMFRAELGTASAAQSSQFHEIQERLGLLRDDDPGPLWGALCRCVDGSTGAPETGAEMGSRAMDILGDLSETWLRLWATHASIVMRFIGDRAGTGGTSGAAYLRRNLAKLRARALKPPPETRGCPLARPLGDDTAEAVSPVATMPDKQHVACTRALKR